MLITPTVPSIDASHIVTSKDIVAAATPTAKPVTLQSSELSNLQPPAAKVVCHRKSDALPGLFDEDDIAYASIEAKVESDENVEKSLE